MDIFTLHARYIVIGTEICPSTGRMHSQIYVEFNQPVTRGQAQTYMNAPKAHCEPRKGTREQARDYCMETLARPATETMLREGRAPGKTLSYIEWGDWDKGGQGARSDIVDLRSDIQLGMSDVELYEKHTAMWRHDRAARNYRMVLLEKQYKEEGWKKKNVEIFYGPTGTGKTRRAIEEAGENYFMKFRATGEWWDGYAGEDTIILDEFDGGASKMTAILQLCDGYYAKLPIKGGFIVMKPRKIIFTSNSDPAHWWNCSDEHWDAFLRRVTKKEQMGEWKVKLQLTLTPPK